MPEKIHNFLLGEPLKRKIPRRMLFPYLFRAQGKCFFMTEDERFGLCPPTTRPGDIIVALYGGLVPFVLRPVYILGLGASTTGATEVRPPRRANPDAVALRHGRP